MGQQEINPQTTNYQNEPANPAGHQQKPIGFTGPPVLKPLVSGVSTSQHIRYYR